MKKALLGALAAAGLALGAGSATALSVDEYDVVRQVFCSTPGAVIDLSYSNQYGDYERREGTWLNGDRVGAHTCITRDIQAGEYGDYVSTSIVDTDGGYVYCALWVNGVKASESADNSSLYSYALCG